MLKYYINNVYWSISNNINIVIEKIVLLHKK